MPKKGKKKGGGRKPMTEEEKLLYQRQKAQAEEEMARKKQNMLTQFLKDKLQKEERNSTINQHKLTQQWREVLRQTRAAEMRGEISIISQTFERIVDRKDSVIESLVSDLSEAEQQSAIAFRAHLRSVDQLLKLQKFRLETLELQWKSNLEQLNSEFNIERKDILTQHQQEIDYLEDVAFSMKQNYTKIENVAKLDFQSAHDDIKNQSTEDKHSLNAQLKGTVNDLWKQYQNVLHTYNKATEERRIAFNSLEVTDKRSSQEIAMEIKRLQKLQDTINSLRSRLVSSQKENKESELDLRGAREEVVRNVQQLRVKLGQAQISGRRQLANLTMLSNNSIKRLMDIIGKGQKLLRLVEICRKFETEHEKVLPFYESSLSAEELREVQAHAVIPPSEELAKAMMDYASLERFWQPYNKVLLERFCLEREKMVLGQENQQLRVLLKQYLDGISVNDEVLRRHNPLLIVSRPSLQAPSVSNTQSPKNCTVIEAAHVVQHIL